MIFRRLCTPKKHNDAMHRLIFFGAQIHSESHGPIRRFLVDSVLDYDYEIPLNFGARWSNFQLRPPVGDF